MIARRRDLDRRSVTVPDHRASEARQHTLAKLASPLTVPSYLTGLAHHAHTLLAMPCAQTIDENCGICLEPFVDAYVLDCAHIFCRGCIDMYRQRGVNPACPYCRAPLPPSAYDCIDKWHTVSDLVLANLEQGNTLFAQTNQPLLLQYAHRAIQADPNHAEAHLCLGRSLTGEMGGDDIDGAESEFREAVRCDPTEAKCHDGLGIFLFRFRRDYVGAAIAFREAIRCDPNDGQAQYNLAVAVKIHTVAQSTTKGG
jgi:tetratricopeptide (TPR) repeat protein